AQLEAAADEVAAPGDQGADRGAEALREACADRVEAGDELALGDAGRGGGVPDPRAVEVDGEAELVRCGDHVGELRAVPAHAAAAVVGVLDRDHAGQRQVRIIAGLVGRANVVGGEAEVRHHAGLETGQRGEGARL